MLDPTMALVAKFERDVKANRLLKYDPYPWQKQFHAAGRDYVERMLMAANRCITPSTVVETVPRPRQIAEVLGEPRFYVRSWADGCECVAQAAGVFLKGIEPAFRVLLDSGEWFDCSRRHQVLTTGGWLSLDRLIQLSSGLRWTQTRAGYQASCGAGAHLDGQQLLLAVGSDLARPPSQDGVRQRGLVFERTDAAERISKCTRTYLGRDRFAIEDDPQRIADLCAEFPDPAPCIDALCKTSIHQELLRCAAELSREPEVYGAAARQFSSERSWDGQNGCHVFGDSLEGQCGEAQGLPRSVSRYGHHETSLQSFDGADRIETFYPSDHRDIIGRNRIVALIPLGFQPILDFTVEGTHCYRAGGAIHHNTGKTMSAAAELSYHLTGDYPDWWDGKRFNKPILGWTGSPTNETSRDIVQAELLGGLGQQLGTGWIPRNRIVGRPTTRQAGVKDVVDKFEIKHKSGGVSVCIQKTYEQGWQKWQGTAPHVVWLDEEPDDYTIYSEAQTRILTSSGIVLVTFTPLLGVTELVEHFQTGGPGIYLKSATWDDAPHLSQDDKDRLALSYREHERDARTQGIPMMGEGAVFPIADSLIRVDPFKIPDHWARIKGCDFGIDHPAAGVELVWDRDQDVIYVIDGHKKANELAPYHASWLSKTNKRIPVAWPHDGMNREKSGGKTLAQRYRELGANMLSKSARYPKVRGEEKEKAGPQPVEPIVDEVLERMSTGRFKVFSSVPEWLEEKRSYHRKDGKIVAKRDDLLKATFYAVMMKRYAVAPGSFAERQAEAQAPIATTRL